MTSMMKMVRTKFEIQTNMSVQLKMIYVHESMQVPAFSTQTSTRDKNPIFSTSFGSVTYTRGKYRIFVSFFISQNLVPFFFQPPLPPIPIPTMFFYTPCLKKNSLDWAPHLSSPSESSSPYCSPLEYVWLAVDDDGYWPLGMEPPPALTVKKVGIIPSWPPEGVEEVGVYLLVPSSLSISLDRRSSSPTGRCILWVNVWGCGCGD